MRSEAEAEAETETEEEESYCMERSIELGIDQNKQSSISIE